MIEILSAFAVFACLLLSAFAAGILITGIAHLLGFPPVAQGAMGISLGVLWLFGGLMTLDDAFG